ncbi:MAG: hypothetical protein L6461_17870 [Anaerolineae bacterium]|nr:hypothetical protein [Anaerolineae bacterium]
MIFILSLAVFFYVAGYRLDSVRTEVVFPKYFREKIRPPKFFYLICASPKSNKHPVGVMFALGLASQLMGIGFAIFGLVFYANPDLVILSGLNRVVAEMVSLCAVLLASYIISYWLAQKYPYNE